MKIGILGYGNVGQKLAKLLADAGYEVTVGVRELSNETTIPYAQADYASVAAKVDVLAIAIPYQAALAVLSELAPLLKDKIVMDLTNPLNADWSPMLLGQDNSAGEEIARAVHGAHVVKAFNTIFADVMQAELINRDGQRISAFVAGDQQAAKDVMMALAKSVGFAPVDTGGLINARYLEAIAHLNIQLAVGQQGGTNAAFIFHQVK